MPRLLYCQDMQPAGGCYPQHWELSCSDSSVVRGQFEERHQHLKLYPDPTSALNHCEAWGNLLISFSRSECHNVNILTWETCERENVEVGLVEVVSKFSLIFIILGARVVRISLPPQKIQKPVLFYYYLNHSFL